ncbi:MAG: PaaI family thioesterase [Verrucomicrobiae bacterium]|nr:PaaI family thioesterase [Verrucomicrobiae bacterium]
MSTHIKPAGTVPTPTTAWHLASLRVWVENTTNRQRRSEWNKVRRPAPVKVPFLALAAEGAVFRNTLGFGYFQLAFGLLNEQNCFMALTLPRTKSCFVCGVENRLGLNLGFTLEGDTVVATFRFLPEHGGFKHAVHGGLIATVIDEAMVWACGVLCRKLTYSAELTVRYHRTITPGEEVKIVGVMTANHKNRLFEAKAQILNSAGKLLASGTGKYMPVPHDLVPEMRRDFVGDIGQFID